MGREGNKKASELTDMLFRRILQFKVDGIAGCNGNLSRGLLSRKNLTCGKSAASSEGISFYPPPHPVAKGAVPRERAAGTPLKTSKSNCNRQ
jgi:hypothetical protein